MAAIALYKNSRIGKFLEDTLEEMISEEKLSPQLAFNVYLQFVESMTNALETKVPTRLSIRGHLHTYNFIDNVWTFNLQDATFRHNDGTEENVARVRIVACDSKVA